MPPFSILDPQHDLNACTPYSRNSALYSISFISCVSRSQSQFLLLTRKDWRVFTLAGSSGSGSQGNERAEPWFFSYWFFMILVLFMFVSAQCFTLTSCSIYAFLIKKLINLSEHEQCKGKVQKRTDRKLARDRGGQREKKNKQKVEEWNAVETDNKADIKMEDRMGKQRRREAGELIDCSVIKGFPLLLVRGAF